MFKGDDDVLNQIQNIFYRLSDYDCLLPDFGVEKIDRKINKETLDKIELWHYISLNHISGHLILCLLLFCS